MKDRAERPMPHESDAGSGNAAPRMASGLTVPGLPPFGALTLGALAVCVVSGIALLAGFEPGRPLLSTLAFETGRPFGWFVRGVHAWSAHLSLLALLAHTADHVLRRSYRDTPASTWAALVASLPVTLYLMLGGRALPLDAEGQGVASVLHGILSQVPWAGAALAAWLVGGPEGNAHVLAAHHATSATLVLALITVFHVRKLAPDAPSVGVALGLSGIVALLMRPGLVGVAPGGRLDGPWYMGGLRLALEHVPGWAAALMAPASMLALLLALPLARGRVGAWVRGVLAVALAMAVALTIAAVRV